MSGLGVVVDWDSPVDPQHLDSMMSLIPHRVSGRSERAVFEHAALAGVGATHGQLTIVGDLRLWNLDRLRSRAGGRSATGGMDNCQLILEAYRRAGTAAFDEIDGDFAFVIWDDKERRLVAARDRFGVKPLFLERTPTGIRLASESKQLAATSTRPVEPDSYAVAEYLLERNRETRSTFFEGIQRVLPSTTLVVDESRFSEIDYWTPRNNPTSIASGESIATEFRELLTDSVRRRVGTSSCVASHLSGGLDSASVTASAHILVERELVDPQQFHTVSAVFPGHAIDESPWIDEIADRQPFRHHDMVQVIEDASLFEQDMWVTDQPRVDRIRGMWSDTARIGRDVGATMVLTGIGGDDLLDYYTLFADRMRHGPVTRRWRDLRAHANQRGLGTRQALVAAAREGLPDNAKRPLRRLLRRSVDRRGLLSTDLWESYLAGTPTTTPLEFGYPTDTQNLVIAASRHPLLVWSNEMQEAEYASAGLGISHPYLDRSVIEYLASVSIDDRPFDGRTKALVRDGYAGLLPQSVIGRRTKTFADEYLATIFNTHALYFRSRFPEVSTAGASYLDSRRYQILLSSVDAGTQTDDEREMLWAAWTLMAWLEGLSHYEKAQKRNMR